MNAKPGWLKGVFERAESTKTYRFDDGEQTQTVTVKDLEKLAKLCEAAHADVQIHKAVLVDAENHVVECQAEVMKAETHLERRQADYLKAASERAGVPCLM